MSPPRARGGQLSGNFCDDFAVFIENDETDVAETVMAPSKRAGVRAVDEVNQSLPPQLQGGPLRVLRVAAPEGFSDDNLHVSPPFRGVCVKVLMRP